MKASQLLLFAAPATSSIFNIFPRAVSQDYLNSVCSPNITNPTVIPPCISVSTIEGLCKPNGTSSLAYQASAECLCNAPSTYFVDWVGCRKCLEVHGGMSELEYNGYVLQASAASSSMCSGTPTTNIAGVFSAAVFTGTPTGATTSSDQFPSNSAVSLYYTAPGPQGPGTITGSATAATQSGSGSTASTALLMSSVTTQEPPSTNTKSSTSSSSSSNAMTTAASLSALALAIAGGMAAAVL